MSEDKNYPVHRIQFQEEGKDQRGLLEYGKPVEVATTWTRKEGKKGELMNWHISPEKLPKGVYTLVDNDRGTEANQGSEQSAHIISFCEKRVDGQGQESLGPPIEVGSAKPRDGVDGKRIEWNIDPKHLGEGAYFTLEAGREKGKQTHSPDHFAKIERDQKSQSSSLER